MDIKLFEIRAVGKSLRINRGEILVFQRHRPKLCAAVEGLINNVMHFRKYNRGQAAAICKGFVVNAGDRLRDSDGGQATAVLVFVSYYISSICTLNDRKVMT